MRLRKIKLAGFKSFVDPTNFLVPSQLVAIVGPNGCGKSNIIDAVRWVMGESSVRHLRGDSMEDVIFNGSSSRKPVGQAAIELVFDNSDDNTKTKISGPWLQYNEIAIKRVLNRGGQSSYFINNTRCRRRDITGIFLGTGLGPRSYAIIEQGMISRIIDSKPDDLRVILEEAAGISKYKERRRETELRIRHTRENLQRLNDVREELQRQLQHLQKQADNAERFKKYRQQQRTLQAQLLALRWRGYEQLVVNHDQSIADNSTLLEAHIADQRAVETAIVRAREQQQKSSLQLQQQQEQHYKIGAEIARIEQLLDHRKELQRRQLEEQQNVTQALAQLQQQEQQDKERLQALELDLQTAEPDLAAAEEREHWSAEKLQVLEQDLEQARVAMQEYNQQRSTTQQQAEIERVRIEQFERQQWQTEQRIQRLQAEQSIYENPELEQELQQLQLRQEQIAELSDQYQEQIATLTEQVTDRQELQQATGQTLNANQQQSQTAAARLVSLQTLQQAALHDNEQQLQSWLKQQGLESAPRLAESLRVEKNWQKAVETVLDGLSDALYVADIAEQSQDLPAIDHGRLTLFESDSDSVVAGNLSDKVSSPWPIAHFLAGIDTAANLEDALNRRHTLQAWQSLITPEGIWLGKHWLRWQQNGDDVGVIARAEEIEQLQQQLAELRVQLQSDEESLARQHAGLQMLVAENQQLQQQYQSLQQEQAVADGQTQALTQRIAEQRQRLQTVDTEMQLLVEQQQQSSSELGFARGRLEQSLLYLEQLEDGQVPLKADWEQRQYELTSLRNEAQQYRQQVQQSTVVLESLRSEHRAVQQALLRLAEQRQQMLHRQQQLIQTELVEDATEQRQQLEIWLQKRVESEQQLQQAQHQLQQQETVLNEYEQQRQTHISNVESQREVLAQLKLARSEAHIHRQTVYEQLLELDDKPQSIEIESGRDENYFVEQLQQLEKRIQRLGAINLAAIDEYQQLSQRKTYLDAQNTDLCDALAVLEEVIAKIDGETRNRFKQTYGQINAGLQRLFPKLFAGGQAYLDIVGEDNLDAGVTIMAQPPGKRIGTIHLLSGGEKALTAIALIFSIFELNPAPFCLLDEVDAPLDENNVVRFGELLQEMSKQVQFILVTHNKASMGIAHQLSGVTMHEPGVSRLVAVDLDEAVRLVAA